MNYIVAAILVCLDPYNDKSLIKSKNLFLDEFLFLYKSYETNCFWIFVYIMQK